MAEIQLIYKDNVVGKFYVDQSCINCGLCSKIATNNFCHSQEQDHDIVYKQPTTEQEIADCIDAFESCPVEAIGDDGDKKISCLIS